jgi:hypothetical protein
VSGHVNRCYINISWSNNLLAVFESTHNGQSKVYFFLLIALLTAVNRGEFRRRQTRQLPRAVDLKGRFLVLVVVKC